MISDCPLFNAGKGAVFNIDGKVSTHITLQLLRFGAFDFCEFKE